MGPPYKSISIARFCRNNLSGQTISMVAMEIIYHPSGISSEIKVLFCPFVDFNVNIGSALLSDSVGIRGSRIHSPLLEVFFEEVPLMTQDNKQKIHFYKMTGAGNDFIFIDNRNDLVDADHCRDLVRAACRRKLSVGADGVVLIENDPEVDFKWRFFNSDASEAEMCGNAARCAVRFAYLTGIVHKPTVVFRTLPGIIQGEILDAGVKVQMTNPHSLEPDLHLEGDGHRFVFDFIDTGVPHAVCFLKDENELKAVDVSGRGKTFRFHPHFQPAGANINFACVLNAHQMIVRTYERGVEGETLACGTGVTASVLTAAVRDRVASPVEVRTQGGESLTIHFERAANLNEFKGVFMEGEARVVYEADLWTETL
jgi:diaminopimelate epimerase